MKKRVISIITAVFMLMTVVSVSAPVVQADSQTGGLLWYYKDSSNNALTGVNSPAIDENGEYIYMASAKNFYKIKAENGKLAGKVTLSGSVGYNKLAVTVAAGKAFIPLGAGKMDVVDVTSMKLLKTVQFADKESHKGHQTLTPAAYDEEYNAVYLGTWRRGYEGVYVKVSLDDYSAETIATNQAGFYWAGACVSGDYVVFGSTSVASKDNDDLNTPESGDAVLYAYNKADGTLLETVLPESGSICTSVVEYGGKFYFVSKPGKLYEAEIIDGQLKASTKITLAGVSTCVPVISDGKVYVGSAANVEVIDIQSWQVTAKYATPADVKNITLVGDKIFCTYNNKPGGIYDVKAGADYFAPTSGSMQNFCISAIVVGADGTLYYTNDSNNLMAVCDSSLLPKVAAQKTLTVKMTGYNAFKLSWSKQEVTGYQVKYKVQYQKKGGSWITYKAGATGTSCTKNSLTAGVQYRFRVTPYVTLNGITYNGTAKTTGYFYTLEAPKQPTAKRKNATKTTLSWNKVNGATGYKVYRANKKNGNYKLVKTVNKTSLIVSAKKGSQYYYKVRAYKGSVLGPMSAARYYKFK